MTTDLPVTQLLAQIRVQIESVVSYAESPLINQLETGFRHTPLTVRETEQRYSESCRFAAQDAAEALRLLGELEQKLAELEAGIRKVRDGYASQMKFCDIEALGYFREFLRRIDAVLPSPPKGDVA